MTIRTAELSITSTATMVDLQELQDGVLFENKGTTTVYIRISKIFSSVTLQDLQLQAGQSVQILQGFQFFHIMTASGSTTLKYTCWNRG